MADMVRNEDKHVVYVYGTLRPGGSVFHMVPGVLYDLGWYPGIDLKSPECGTMVFAERIEVDDDRLEQLDRYEGYYEDRPDLSLFKRVPYLDGWIYVYNHSFEGRKVVEGGDWLVHTGKREAVFAGDPCALVDRDHNGGPPLGQDVNEDGETGVAA